MMTRTLLCVVAMVLFGVPLRGVPAQFPAHSGATSVEQEGVLRADALLVDAGVRSDVSTFERLWAADVMFIGNDGRIWDRLARLESFRSGQRDNAAARDLDVYVRLYRDAAVLMKTSAVAGKLEGRVFESRSILTRMFVREQGRWLLAHQHSARLEDQLPLHAMGGRLPPAPPAMPKQQDELLAVDRSLTRAGRGDRAGLEQMWTGDVVYIRSDGSVSDKARWLASAGGRFDNVPGETQTQLRVYRDGAGVLVKTSKTENGGWISTSVYIKQEDRWLLAHRHDSRLERR